MPGYIYSIDELAELLSWGEELVLGGNLEETKSRESESPSLSTKEGISGKGPMEGDVAVLSYFIGENRSYLFVATRDTLEAFPLPAPRGRIKALIKHVGSFIDASPVESAVVLGKPYFDRAIAETLSAALLDPADGILSSMKRLIVIRGHDLEALPFEMLLSNQQTNGRSAGPYRRFLVEDFEISYKYSTRLLRPTTSARDDGQPFLFAIGCSTMPVPTDISGSGPTLGKDPSEETKQEVVPQIVSELKWLESEFGDLAVVAIDNEANREVFLRQAERSTIIHIASHSRVCSQHRESGAILLSSGERNEVADSLSVLDVLKMRTSAQLVVLSSCRTATPFEVYSRIDFVKSFLIAGAGSVVASEWDVDDECTLRLMKSFYTHLKTGVRKSKALQAAKKDLIAAGLGNPYCWASFILVGDEQEIVFPAMRQIRFSMAWVFATVAVFTLGLAMFVLQRAHKRHRGSNSSSG